MNKIQGHSNAEQLRKSDPKAELENVNFELCWVTRAGNDVC